MPKTATRARPGRGRTQPTIKSLGFHADYGCRNRGACCDNPWRVVAQPAVRGRIEAAFRDGRLGPDSAAGRSFESAVRTLPTLTGEPLHVVQADGPRGCVFHTGDGCEVRHRVGVEAQPLGCRVFPRVVVRQPRGVFVSLSHFCPTALELLFRADELPSSPVDRPPAFPLSDALQGHDARDHLPPLVAPNLPASWSLFEAWEAAGAQWLTRPDASADELLASWAVVAERIRRRVLEGARPEEIIKPALARALREGPDGVLETVTEERRPTQEFLVLLDGALKLLPADEGFVRDDLAQVRGRYLSSDGEARYAADRARQRFDGSHFEAPLKRYAAARHFANFHAYQGQGLRTAAVSTLFAVKLVQIIALAAAEDGELTQAHFARAVRASDYLLLHLVHRPTMANFFSATERVPVQDILRLALTG